MSTTAVSSDTAPDASVKTAPSPRVVPHLPSWLFYGIALAVIALDQSVKAWVRHSIPVNTTIELWPRVFQFTHAQNRGMAFSLLEGKTIVLIAAAVAVAFGIVILQIRAGRTMPRLIGVALSLALGGAVGNLIDRVWQGYVTDLFDFKLINFPIFNVADSAITIGIALLILRTLFSSDDPAPASAAAQHSAERAPDAPASSVSVERQP